MAVISSAGTGNWADGATWVGGVAPGVTDDGEIEVGHIVTIAAETTAKGWILNGGSIVQNADFICKNTPGCGIWITATNSGGFSSNGTASAPRYIKGEYGAGNIPSILVYHVTSAVDSRILNFDYVQFQWFAGFLGQTTYYIHLEGVGSNRPFITNVTPLIRDQKLVSHFIEGRECGRTYIEGGGCGVIQVQGIIYWDSYDYLTLKNMMAAGTRIAFFYKDTILPKCFIERLSFNPKAGSLWIPFTMTLIEEGND